MSSSDAESSFAERMATVARLAGNANALARATGISRRSIGAYLAGEAEPSRPKLVAISQAAGVSIEWLATGTGLMRGTPLAIPGQLPVRVPEAVRGEPRVVALSDDPGDAFVFVPRYEVRASAGAGALAHSESIVDHLAFKEQWLRRTLGVSPAEVFLLEASGDSMVPTIQHGDLLLIWRAIDYLRDNGIYCLRIWDSIVVKRLRRRAADGAIIVISDNPLYPDEELGQDLAEHVAIIGQVLWHGGIV